MPASTPAHPPLCGRQVNDLDDRTTCIALEPSGRWVVALLSKYSSMALHKLTYHIILRDGTLNWSRVTASEKVGALYDPSLRAPLLSADLAERRRRSKLTTGACGLASSDPLEPAKGRGRGAASSGRRAPQLRRRRDAANKGAQPLAREASPIAGNGGGAGDGGVLSQLAPSSVAADADAPDVEEASVGGDVDLFDLDAEMEGLLEQDLQELAATYGDGAIAPEAAGHGDAGANLLEPEGATIAMDAEFAQAAELADLGGEVDIGLSADAHAAGTGNSAASSSDVAPVAAELAAPQTLKQRLGVADPSPMGYVYHDGRSILRIQRGKPKGSLSVKCYRHPGCSFLLGLAHDPGDDELVEWALKLPAVPAGATTAEGRALAAEHMGLVDIWRPKRKAK